eukprot:scaffold43638_cov22-Tisochrysis_lutea.AAC.1
MTSQDIAASGLHHFASTLIQVATAGGADKAAMLKRLGVDRVVDYKKESLKVCAGFDRGWGAHIISASAGHPDVLLVRGHTFRKSMPCKQTSLEQWVPPLSPNNARHFGRSNCFLGVLKAEYPRGIDVVYESVGGDMFSAAVAALAPRGRLIIIGMMSAYQTAHRCLLKGVVAQAWGYERVCVKAFCKMHGGGAWALSRFFPVFAASRPCVRSAVLS